MLEPTTPDVLAGHDVVVLALPHGASGAVAAELGPDVLVLDCGADHRLADADAWRAYYGSDHAGTWPYGMPELLHADGTRQRDALAGVTRVAVPGCNVTAVTFAIQPGVAAGLVDAGALTATLAVGYSGAGKALKPHLLAAEGLGSAAPYAVGGTHRHIPEIEQNLRAAGAERVRVTFTPVLVPMSRGILATVTAPLAPGADPAAVREAWSQAYAGEPFVGLLPEGQWPTTAATVGANTALVQVAVDERAGTVVAICALDNLVKGTAGAAVQSMNLALGLAGGDRSDHRRGRPVSVTAPQGFRAAGVTAGLKASGRPDLALVVNDGPDHVGAAVFTTNRVVGHPVTWSRQVVADHVVHAVVLNSGGANVCTGPPGFARHPPHRRAGRRSAGRVRGRRRGVLDRPDRRAAADRRAARGRGRRGGRARRGRRPDAATAIMTTDTVTKQAVAERDGWSVGGMAKGAGMLAPALATMLVVLTTDAVVDPADADAALRAATRTTFDRVDSDGCMSTSDTVLLMSSGASGVPADRDALTDALTQVCASLARQLVADAEGATHDIAVRVVGARRPRTPRSRWPVR